MKYFIGMLLFVMVLSVCHAQEAKTNKTEYTVAVDTSKLNIGQQADDVAKVLKKYMDGPLAMYYNASVERNKKVGAIGFWIGLPLLIIGVICFVLSCIICDNIEGPSGLMLVGFLCFFAGAFPFAASLNIYIAPELCAMNDIITKIGMVAH